MVECSFKNYVVLGSSPVTVIYNSIWHKVSNSVKKETDCEPITSKKF